MTDLHFVQFTKREKHPSRTIILVIRGNIITQGRTSLFLVGKISFIFLMALVGYNQNICIELFKATFTH